MGAASWASILIPASASLRLLPARRSLAPPMRRAALLAARRISHGAGVDVVLLTTSTKDNQPIEMAALLVRDRGRVVCLGNTEINLDWRLWFSKEIEFLFSRSTGAGIYDPDYFTRGNDYPIGYVRWSAKRNVIGLSRLARPKQDRPIKSDHPSLRLRRGRRAYSIKIANGELSGAVGIVFEYPNADRHTPESESRTIRFDERCPSANGPARHDRSRQLCKIDASSSLSTRSRT